MKAKHQLVRKRPGLALEITRGMDGNTHLFHYFAVNCVLYPLPRFYKTGERGIDRVFGSKVVGQKAFITTCNQDNSAGSQTGIYVEFTVMTDFSLIIVITHRGSAAAATELVIQMPLHYL